MSGWTGGTANRDWQRDRRSADSGRIGLIDDVRRILTDWRADHGWEPGMVWDARIGWYRRMPALAGTGGGSRDDAIPGV